MKRIAALVSMLLAGTLAVSCKHADVAPGPDVWAVVNGKDITRQEVEKYYRNRVNPEAPSPSQEESLSLKLSILDELINNEILLERANKQGLVASDAEVEDKFTEEKSPYTEDEFQKKLKDANLTVDDLKSDLRRQLTIQKLVNREIVAKISITDQDVKDFYDKNRAQFNVVEPQYHIAQIVVTPRPDPTVRNRKNDKATNDADATRKVQVLEQKLNAGADFFQLAMDYSEDSTSSTGGDLGFQSESSFNRSDPALKKMVLVASSGRSDAADSGPRRRLRDFEADCQGSGGAARAIRSASAEFHPRDAAQSQGAIAPRRLSLRRPRRIPRRKLSSPPGPGIRRQTSRHGIPEVTHSALCASLRSQRLCGNLRIIRTTAKASPAFTACPFTTSNFSMLPALGDFTSFCIFIASTTTIPWPAATTSPAFTNKRITFPGIGAVTCCRPSAKIAPPPFR